MGLFDHLFKHRPDGTEERPIEGAPKPEGDSTPDPQAAFLQPKGYAPGASNPVLAGQQQGFVPVLPTARRPPARPAAPAAPPREAANDIVLHFGDVLARIPAQYLQPGPHDLKRELRFHLEDLTGDLTRGRPGVALSRVAEQCPEFFLHPITEEEDMEVRLPLQKLVEQVTRIRSRPGSIPVFNQRAPTPPFAPRNQPVPPAKPAPAPAPPAAVVPPPVPEVRPEPVEKAAPPVEAAPPPPVAAVPPPPVEPPALVPAEPPVVTPVAEVTAPKVEEPAPPAAPPEPVPEAVEPAPPPEEAETPVLPEPPPVPEPRTPGEGEIDLGLAAIVATLPVEMFSQGRPLIAESYRIGIPFEPIERQLGTGQVEISSAEFWDALPPLLRHHFVLREDLRVPIPLEEIFQNLPVATEKPHLVPPPAAAAAPVLLIPPPEPPAPAEDEKPHASASAAEIASAPTVEPAPAESVAPEPPTPAPPVVEEAAPPPIPAHPPAPPIAASAEEAPAPAPIELAGAAAASEPAPSAASAPPAEDAPPVHVHLAPFRVFTPQVQASEAAEPLPADRPIVLGEPEAPAEAGQQKLVPAAASESAPALEALPTPAAAIEPAPPAVEESPADPPKTSPVAATEAEEARPQMTRFSVLPAREISALRDERENVVAFSAEQPPPVTVETPAAPVAVLHATIPSPPVQPAISADATTSVQPPRIFRPVILPPPRIGGHAPVPPVNLAPPTLGGTPPNAPGLISLVPAPPDEPSPPPAAPNPPAPEPPPLSLAPSAPPQEPPPIPAEPPPVEPITHHPSPITPAEPPPALHLHLPPLPTAEPPVPAGHEPPLPALAISRFDQHSLQSLFMTDETLDLPKVARLAAALPGIEWCVISNRDESVSGGQMPAGFEMGALRGLAPQVGAAAHLLPIGELKNFTLFGAAFSVSFFERGPVCLCVVHRARSFVPGVREKLVAVTEELAR